MTDDLTVFVERFLTERRRLGFQLTSCAYSLRSFAERVRASGHRGPLTVEVMARWAREDSSRSDQPRAWAQRLRQLRSFARWLRQFEPSTEVPDDSTFGRRQSRGTPHIYSEYQVGQLLAAARHLDASRGLRGVVYETLFGLIASTGLRVSEALALLVGDVDLRHGVLTIRRTKFGKSRAVPLHPSTTRALIQYRAKRDQAGASVLHRHARGPVRQAVGSAPGQMRLCRHSPQPGLGQPRFPSRAAHPRPPPHVRGPAHSAVAARAGRRGSGDVVPVDVRRACAGNRHVLVHAGGA